MGASGKGSKDMLTMLTMLERQSIEGRIEDLDRDITTAESRAEFFGGSELNAAICAEWTAEARHLRERRAALMRRLNADGAARNVAAMREALAGPDPLYALEMAYSTLNEAGAAVRDVLRSGQGDAAKLAAVRAILDEAD